MDNSTNPINVNQENFIASTPTSEQTHGAMISDKTTNEGDRFGMRYIPMTLTALEERFSFTAVLISVIGYIVIAAFGQLNSFYKYFGYILFLLFVFCLYKALQKEKFLFKLSKFQTIILVLFILAFSFFIFENHRHLREAVRFLQNHFH